MTCQARQYSDQMQCARCGLAWDVKDPEPPKCLTPNELGVRKLKGLKADWIEIDGKRGYL